MLLLRVLPVLVLLADDGASWKFDSKEEGVTLMRRDRPGTVIREFKATGIIDAPPTEVWKVLRDFQNYKDLTAYAQKTEVVGTESDGKVVHLYVVTAPPLIDKRDYCVKYVDESDWKDGKGYYQQSFTLSDKGPPPAKEGMVRMKLFDGQWRLEPVEDGKKTSVTYTIAADPGGSLPNWVVNSLAGPGVRNTFKTIRQRSVPKK